MKTNPELRKEAKELLAGNWTVTVTIALLATLVTSAPSLFNLTESVTTSLISLILVIAISFPLNFGVKMTFMSFCRGEQLKVENILGMFNKTYYGKSVILGLLMSIYTFLWTLLLIVPGIIKSLSYAMAPYIMLDNPNISAEEAICKSMQMMDGHKMNLFLIQLGYWGYGLLSLLLLGIPLLWIMPYYEVVYIKFYEEIKNENRTPEAIAQV